MNVDQYVHVIHVNISSYGEGGSLMLIDPLASLTWVFYSIYINIEI